MGNPLSRIIVDIVIDKIYDDIITKFSSHIKYCKRYVDDSIIINNKLLDYHLQITVRYIQHLPKLTQIHS